jgi:tetratricopeptide (TPR) repeat protein
LIAGDAVAFYVTKLLLPLHLSPHYGRTPERVLAHVWIYGTGLLPWGLGAWLWWQRQRLPGLATATGVFVLNLLPVLGLIPFGFQGFSTVADRYAYLALLGPAWGLAWGIARSEHHRLVLIGCLTLGIGLGVRTAGQTGYWHDTVTLFAHALRLNPDSYLAHASLGDALAKQHQLDEAARHYRAALRLEPNYPAAHANLGIILRQQGQLEAAITQSRLALQLDPQLAVAHLNLGDTFKQQGKLTEALQHYVAALRLQPNDAKVYIALGVMYAEQDKLTEAITYYTAALRLRPGWSIPYNNLGQVLVKQGKLAEALEQFAQATRYPPLLPESSYNLGLTASKLGRIPTAIAAYREAWHRRPGWLQVANNLAWLLVTQPQPSPSNIAEAIRLAEGATQTAEHQDATVLHTLAVAYAAAARWPEAIQVAARALAYAKATDNADLAAQIRQHLHNYQQQQQATLPLRP